MQRLPPTLPDDLLYTKLAPPRVQSSLVPRGALVARLEAGLTHKLTVISAPAGSGKTTLIGEWISERGDAAPVGWVALDAGDNDPVRFWRYVVSACRSFDAALGRSTMATLRTTNITSFEGVLTTFINELSQLHDRCVLVLEDFHVIVGQEVLDSCAYLIEHLPATLHLVLLARSEPAMPLARLRARNELSEFTGGDLRFTPDEIRSFVQQTLQLTLPAEAIARLEQRTEGWAAGLRLMALALHGRTDSHDAEEILSAFSGGHRYVLEYLIAEVLATQPASVQEFLLQTSLFSRLTGALCDAITGRDDSTLLLTKLERANLFLVPLGDDGRHAWYRYQALFAEAMRHHARQRLAESSLRALMEKASRWYEERGLTEEAIETALAASGFDRAARLIEQSIAKQSHTELHTLGRWAEQLPEAVLCNYPDVCFNYARMILFTSDRHAPATAIRLEVPLHWAEQVWRQGKNDARLGQVWALRSMAAARQGDLAHAFAYSREALELLPAHDVYWRGVCLLNAGLEELLGGRIDTAQQRLIEARALCGAAQSLPGVLAATSMLGDACIWLGEFDQAGQFFQQVLAEAVGGDEMLDDQALAWLGLATIAYERNDLDAAEQQAARAQALGTKRANEDTAVHASLLLARLKQARGQTAQATDMLRGLAARIQRPRLLRQVQGGLARLALSSGDVGTAQHTPAAQQGTVVDAPGVDPPYVQQEQTVFLAARIHLARGEPQVARLLLEPWRVDARKNGRLRSELEILCLQALASAAQGAEPEAAGTLRQALTLAQRQDFRRTFLDEGEAMALLLQTTLPGLGKRPVATYAMTLLRSFATARPFHAQSTHHPAFPMLEPLSAQELRVLRLLAAGRTNPEIAAEFVVSTNTIKTQVQSIFRKLNVNGRDEAAEAARQMNLL